MHLIRIENGTSQTDFDPQSLGGKAYQQALGAVDGLPVVDSLVLATSAFPGRSWVDQRIGNLSQEKAKDVKLLLDDLGIDLQSAVSPMCPGGLFAVRSSATFEDQEVASFAGSFETRLNTAPENIYSAVFDVWASTFTDRVEGYLRDRGLADQTQNLKMAVLIQPMIDPLVAGVALSHPLGRPSDPLIPVDIVRGLGEALVSGRATPQSFLVERGTWAIVELQNALDVPLIYEFASQIGRVVEFLEIARGTPQDIEFAIDSNHRFVLLQNRPIVRFGS